MKLKQQTFITYIYMGVVSVFIKKMQFLIYVFLKAWYAYRRTYFSELGYRAAADLDLFIRLL